MNVLLAYPYYPYASVSTFDEPLGILYLASALLKAGHRVEVVDLTFRREIGGWTEKINWAELIGISAPTPLFGSADVLLQHVKKVKPGIRTVVGGPHATVNPAQALNAGFDIAVIGEGESTLVDLVRALEEKRPLEAVAGIAYRDGNEVKYTPLRPFIPHLDQIPFPSRHFIDYSRYRRLGIISMRGCPYRCLYCKPVEEKLFGKKLRKRSLENVTEEIDELIQGYGNRTINFKDDTLTVNQSEWFAGLDEHLRSRNLRLDWICSSRVDTVDKKKLQVMKSAGCRQIFFGIESGSQRILDYYQKDISVERIIETFDMCHSVGIKPCASVMLGAPPETREDLEKTYDLVRRIKPFTWHMHITTPLCGSYLYERAQAEKRIEKTTDYRAFEPTGNLYRLYLPMKLDHLAENDIAEFRDRINRHMKLRLLRRCLVDLHLWKEFLLSRGMRTIAYNFLKRHFRIFRRNTRVPRHSPGHWN